MVGRAVLMYRIGHLTVKGWRLSVTKNVKVIRYS